MIKIPPANVRVENDVIDFYGIQFMVMANGFRGLSTLDQPHKSEVVLHICTDGYENCFFTA